MTHTFNLTFEEKVLNELKNLRERVERLENPNRHIQPIQPFMPSPPATWKPITTCGKCGLKMDGPMGYCCPHKDCPCGMGPVWCSTSELK